MYVFYLREFVKTSVILTPSALLVGCEPQFVLQIRGIRRGVQKSCFEEKKMELARSPDLKSQKAICCLLHLLDAFFI